MSDYGHLVLTVADYVTIVAVYIDFFFKMDASCPGTVRSRRSWQTGTDDILAIVLMLPEKKYIHMCIYMIDISLFLFFYTHLAYYYPPLRCSLCRKKKFHKTHKRLEVGTNLP